MDERIVEIKQGDNLVKKTCRELGITQKKLAGIMGVSAQTVSNWGRDFNNGKLEKTTQLALEGLIYKQRLSKIQLNISTMI
jgi:transcriptional regulator with XRE-family HTH domain